MSRQTPSISELSQLASLTVALGFVVSIVYDWGFCFALGIDLSILPTTLSDHVRTGILWFPPLLALLIAYIAIEYQFQRVERGLTEEEIIAASGNSKAARIWRYGYIRLFVWMMPLIVINYLLIGDILSTALPVALSVMWLRFARWCHDTPLILIRRSGAVQEAFELIPVAVIVAFFSGYNLAVNAVLIEPYEVNVSRTAQSPDVSESLIRTFDRGILVLDDNKHLEFITWPSISIISSNESYTPFRGVLCEWFGQCAYERNSSNNSMQPTAGSDG